MKKLLVLNLGSSSLKYALYQADGGRIVRLLRDGQSSPPDWNKIKKSLQKEQIDYVGFRVVHGGSKFTETTRVTRVFLKEMLRYSKLAPLHNPPTIELMRHVLDTMPGVLCAASFDTEWFSKMPEYAAYYSIPLSLSKKYQIKKYGFHGLSHEAATEQAKARLKLKSPTIISCHLGSGASVTLFEGGRVRDTSMGFSPNEGLTMSTRSGDVPADLIFFLLDNGYKAEQIRKLLYSKSGLLGICGQADLRKVLAAAKSKANVKLALQIYIYDIQRYIASYAGISRKLDAVVFTGAVSSNKKVINMILSGLSLPKAVKIIVYQEGEMLNIANKTLKCLVK